MSLSFTFVLSLNLKQTSTLNVKMETNSFHPFTKEASIILSSKVDISYKGRRFNTSGLF